MRSTLDESKFGGFKWGEMRGVEVDEDEEGGVGELGLERERKMKL